jgi:hypothetical protein
MAIVPGEKAAHQTLNPIATNLPPLSLVAAVTAAVAMVQQASFHFPDLIAGNYLILVKDGAEGAFRAGDQYV